MQEGRRLLCLIRCFLQALLWLLIRSEASWYSFIFCSLGAELGLASVSSRGLLLEGCRAGVVVH